MSTIESNTNSNTTSNTTITKNPAAAVDATTPLTPEQIVEQLRALRQHVPAYQQLTTIEAQPLQPAANVSEAFVQTSINAVSALPIMETTLGRSAQDLREDTAEAARWTAVEDELRAMLKGVETANLTRRHRIGQAALHAFGIARQLARRPEHGDLLPHIAELKRLNRVRRTRNKTPGAKTTAKPVATQPATPSTQPTESPATAPVKT
ncbi:MAG: hypothetical protein JWN02_1879 [Acidobacteria bacterium]|nr:hypothetical protein [Acidobacteriota bacterium]